MMRNQARSNTYFPPPLRLLGSKIALAISHEGLDWGMPYKTVSELPPAVREHLPAHAQRIYLSAFNNAWEQYAGAQKRREGASREATAHKVAWGAVEHIYEKGRNGRWRKRDAK